MADTTVKFFHSAMPGAPVLSGSAGAVLAVLDACLVNGFGLGNLDSLVIAGGVATATRAAGHSQEVGTVALIAGATVTGGSVNGEQKVLSATATTFTFAAPGIADQTATGTISAKLAAAGWAKPYSGTNLAAYQPTDVAASGRLLRVDDTGTQSARVVGYETMSDVNTGVNPFPTAAQQSGGLFWSKSSTADATARPWMVFADGRMVYMARAYLAASANDYELTAFGDINSLRAGDAYHALLSGMTSAQGGNSVTNAGNYWQNASTVSSGPYMARSYTGLGTSIQVIKQFAAPIGSSSTANSGQDLATFMPFPNPTDGGFYVTPHNIFESGIILRGTSPGFYCSAQRLGAGTLAPRESVSGVTGLAGRTLKAVTVQNSAPATCFFDITGPWR